MNKNMKLVFDRLKDVYYLQTNKVRVISRVKNIKTVVL